MRFTRKLFILATTHENLSKMVPYLEIRKYYNLNFQVTLRFTTLIFKYSRGLWGTVVTQALSALLGAAVTFPVNHLAKYNKRLSDVHFY